MCARYISPSESNILFNRDGTVRHQFVRGQLIIGDPATDVGAANHIDAALDSTDVGGSIVWPNDTDLAGGVIWCEERAGMGALDLAAQSGTLTYLEDGLGQGGHTASFFKALTKTGGDAVVADLGIEYLVLTGSVTFDSVAYTAGQVFKSDGSTTTTSGTGTFRLQIPEALRQAYDENLDAEFALKHLNTGDEAVDYFKWSDGGYDPYDSTVTSDADFYGKTTF